MTDPVDFLPVEAIPDPTPSLPLGAEFHFVPGAVVPQTGGPRQFLTDWRLMEGVLLAVGFQDRNEIKIEGSAVMVAPGLALAAKHVFDPWWEGISTRGVVAFLLAGCSWGQQLWNITHISRVRTTDLAVLTLVPASNLPPHRRFHQAIISARVPRPGEPLMMAGFKAGAQTFAVDDRVAHLDIRPLGAVGRVKAVHTRQRDSAVLPFPVVEIDCSAVGGMSGGPVFDAAGHIVGIVSLSMEAEDDLGPTYASLVYPSLGWRVPALWPPGLLPSSIALIEVDPRLCPIHDRQKVAVDFEANSDSFSLKLNVEP